MMKLHVRYQIRNTMRRSPLGITHRPITLHYMRLTLTILYLQRNVL